MSAQSPANALTLRISVTDRCGIRCAYCMPPEGVPLVPRERILSFEEIVRFVRMVRQGYRVGKVRLTGGEPLVREGMADLVAMLAAEGVPDLALTTNGRRLAALAPVLQRAGLSRVNVSLDTLDPDVFRRLTRGGDLAETLAGIDAALECGLAPVKLNCVVLRSWNTGEVGALARFGIDRGCEVRFLELMPLGCAAQLAESEFVPEAEVQGRLAESLHLTPLPVEQGGTSRRFAVRPADDGREAGGEGVVGFISPRSRPFCTGCRRLRLTSTGRLVACLALGEGPDVRPLLRDGSPDAARALCGVVERELGVKADRPDFRSRRPMTRVGG